MPSFMLPKLDLATDGLRPAHSMPLRARGWVSMRCPWIAACRGIGTVGKPPELTG